MAPPLEVTQWLKRRYPKPAVDPDWLEGCYSWIESDLQLNPATDLDAILHNVETQLLQSNLESSMLAGTGLPANVAELSNTKLQGSPILVEIVSMTDIGHSAFSLQNVRQARIERADLAGLAGDDGDEQDDAEEAGPVPKYPRSMLRFQLSDGTTVLEAIEYRKIPELELGVTPLGYKMLLKNVFIRRGIAWLEPANVILKGYQTEERQAVQDEDFARGLRIRLGKPEEEPAPAQRRQLNNAPQAPAPGPATGHQAPRPPQPINTSSSRPNRPAPPPPAPPPAERMRSPLLEIYDPPTPGPSANRDDDAEQPRKRKIPAQRETAPQVSDTTTSRFFAAGASGAGGKDNGLAGEMRLPPHRQSAVFVSSDSEDVKMGFVADKGKGVAANADDEPAHVPSPKSSEYDFDFSLDEGELMATLDKVEKEHGSSGASVTSATTTQLATGSASGGVAGRSEVEDADVISIEDDEEENEKENVPVPTRNVRRRFGQPSQAPSFGDDVIELSD